MKKILIVFTILFQTYTAHAIPVDQAALEKGMTETLGFDVKILTVRRTWNPLDMYFNVLDNSEIKRIRFTMDRKHFVTCDLIVYPSEPRRARLEYCHSRTINFTHGYVFY